MNARLFVYGTLRRAGENHHLLGPARFLGAGTIFAALWQVGPHTAIRVPAASRVAGEVHELEGGDLARRLAALDRFEGGGYRREAVTVTLDGGGTLEAWAWVLAGAPPAGAPEIAAPGSR